MAHVPGMRLTSNPLGRAVCLMAGMLLLSGTALARVGETRAEIEKRILQPGVGRIYLPNDPGPTSAGPSPAAPAGGSAGAVAGGRRGAGFGGGRGGRSAPDLNPFRDFQSLLPTGLTEVVYLKSDAPANPANLKADPANFPVVNLLNPETCWHLHVMYANGRSVIEAYVRVGVALSEFEVNAVLAVNKGSSVWKKAADATDIESGIGTDYALDDGTIRAKQVGNTLLIFATKVDNYILEQRKAAAAVEQTKAPASVMGF